MGDRMTTAPPKVVLTIEDPPPNSPSRRTLAGRYAEALTFVREHAGQWIALLDFGEREALAKTTATGLDTQVPDIEFTVRGSKIYARATKAETVVE